MTTERAVVLNWCDANAMIAKARARGWTDEAGGDSILDLVEEYEGEQVREFPSVTKAKEYGRRIKSRDFWGQPSIIVYEWPDSHRRSWEREEIERLRYVGDGFGWEAVE